MKIKYKLSRLLVALLLVMAHIPWGATVSAQETIDVVVNVFLQVQGGEPNAQSQISYDILNESKTEFLWSYRSNEPPQEDLSLAPGNYVFRLYDGGGFVRDGSEIGPEKVEQTIAQRTEDDLANNRTKVELANKGEVLTQGDGSRIYDLPFTVTAGPDLINGTTTELDVYLADALSQSEESSDGSETSTPEPEASQVTFTVIDENSQPVSGVTIQLGEQQVITTEQGIAQFADLQAGDLMLNIVSIPEGYDGELNDMLLIEPGQVLDITLNVTTAAPEVGTLTFKVVDQNQAPVSGVVIQVNESQVTSNEVGEVSISELPNGDYNFFVVALPEGYSGDVASVTSVNANETNTEVLTITKDAPQAGSANFVVMDQEGSAVNGATLMVADQQITTNESGAASLGDLPIGDYAYSLVALPEGYTGEVAGTVTVSTDVTDPIQITVERTPQSGTISFMIVDQDQSPVAGATITINDQQITTDGEGRASLGDLPIGDYAYSLVALPEGYTGDVAGTVTVTAEATDPIQITVERTPQSGNATFVVVDQDQSPVAGATITINDQQITTDGEGRASLGNLPIGDYAYSLVALPEGYTGDVAGTVTVTAEATDPIQITVERTPQSGTISFMIVDQDQSPVAGATITINDQQITTDGEGRASLGDLPIGTYAYSLSGLPEGYTGEASGDLVVTAEATDPIQLTVERTPQSGNATFVVVDQDQSAVAGVTITINDQQITTDGEGRASLGNLPIGDYAYSLVALPEGYTGDVAGTVTVTAEATDPIQLTVERTPQSGNANFVVVDQDDTPVNGVTLNINDQQITTDAEGEASIMGLPVGDYPYSIASMPDGYSGESNGTIAIAEGEITTTTIKITKDAQYGAITFTVKDQQQQPVVGAVIRMNERDFTTNIDGEAIILEVEAGRDLNYQVVSLPEGYTGQVQGVVQAVVNETVTEEITVQREIAKAKLTIRVIDQTNRPVEGAVIQLNSENDATTDAEGNAIFSELDPKTYNYVITELPERYSHDLSTQEINLAEGSDETITLNVNREITQRGISIRLIDQDENPVVGATIVLNNQTQTTNEAGRVVFSNLDPRVYTYQITELPEGYQGATEGEIELTEAEDVALDVRVEREIEPGTATITVVDQDNQPVHDATVKFGGLSQSTDTEGRTRFTSLEPGNYYYSVTEALAGYTESDEEKRVTIEEAMEFTDTLAIERNPEVGQVNLKIVNDGQKPIATVTVKLGDEEAVTNNDGIAAFKDLTPGDYQFEVTKAPEEYLLDTADATITVIANQTVTQTISLQTKPVESESESSSETSSESQESEPDESEAEAATQRYIDEATGVEVWVNPADAGKVVKLQVQKITNRLDPEPAALNGQKTDVFELVLLDRNNERVNLTRVAQVKLPTQPVTSQLRVVRISGANTSNLTFSLHNQKVNFSTQALGTFAILYGPQAESSSETSSNQSQSESQQSTSVSVSKSTDVESADGDLPATGEIRSIWIFVGASLLLLMGVNLIYRRRKAD